MKISYHPKTHRVVVSGGDHGTLNEEISFIAKNTTFSQSENLAQAITNYVSSDIRRSVELPITMDIGLDHFVIFPTAIKRDYPVWGHVDIVWEEEKSFGIYRLVIDPGKVIPMHHHAVMTEREMILTDGLTTSGRFLEKGTTRKWNHYEPHEYRNATQEPQMILCIDFPPFIPQDEILV